MESTKELQSMDHSLTSSTALGSCMSSKIETNQNVSAQTRGTLENEYITHKSSPFVLVLTPIPTVPIRGVQCCETLLTNTSHHAAQKTCSVHCATLHLYCSSVWGVSWLTDVELGRSKYICMIHSQSATSDPYILLRGATISAVFKILHHLRTLARTWVTKITLHSHPWGIQISQNIFKWSSRD